MVSRKQILLIIAADRREFEQFPKQGWRIRPLELGLDYSAEAVCSNGDALLVANGPGRALATQAFDRACQTCRPRAVVSTGFCGALDPGLSLAEIFLAQKIIQFEGALEYPGMLPLFHGRQPAYTGTLLTIDRVAQTAAEKAQLRKSGAQAVDMEAAAIAASAQAGQIPFYCVRAVSDEAEKTFPVDLNQARNPDGRFSGWKVARQAGLRPSRWRELLALNRDAKTASAALARFLAACEF